MSDNDTVDNPTNQRFLFRQVPEAYPMANSSYELLSETPTKIECWTKRIPPNALTNFFILTLSSQDTVFTEKNFTQKWEWDFEKLSIEKKNGRGQVSFKYVKKHRYEISLTYYGHLLIAMMAHITDADKAKEAK